MSLEIVGLLLLVAALVGIVAKRLHLPYSIGLIVAGIALSFWPRLAGIGLSRQLLFTVLLPPLIFEAALYIHWPELKKDLWVVVALSTIGVVLSAFVTGAGLRYLAGWQWSSALLFGILIAATDPVSVIATFKETKKRGRLRFLVEAESLFNDGTAAVAFAVGLAFVAGDSMGPLKVGLLLIETTGGAVFCGGLVAMLVLFLSGRTDDHLVEITLTTLSAYGSFLLADRLGFSGVLATLVAGIIVGNLGPGRAISKNKGKVAVESFWEYAAFVATSFVFLLLGITETQHSFAGLVPTALLAIGLVLAGRAAAVYVTLLLFASAPTRVSMQHQHILFWGGLRGALALALALSLPLETPRRAEIVTVSFAVVAFSVFVQGLTVIPMVRRAD
jgi:monovalent cation:H+ antiporter, CPA1 family